jgi:hypothetical protein
VGTDTVQCGNACESLPGPAVENVYSIINCLSPAGVCEIVQRAQQLRGVFPIHFHPSPPPASCHAKFSQNSVRPRQPSSHHDSQNHVSMTPFGSSILAHKYGAKLTSPIRPRHVLVRMYRTTVLRCFLRFSRK